MIKFEHTKVMNFEAAFRGMRNPLNSWNKSDSRFAYTCGECDNCAEYITAGDCCIKLGDNDLDLAKSLINAGTDHRKFLRQILVSVDITAPLYWWKEFDTYKVGTVANSTSTMHKIHSKELTLDDFSIEYLNNLECIELKSTGEFVVPHGFFNMKLDLLNEYRNLFLETNDKRWWYALIQELPSSYNQKRTVTLNYENIRNMYSSRKRHKLDEWSEGFIKWVEQLPYASHLLL